MSKTIQELFPEIEILDTEPVEVANPYTGKTVTLTPEEVAVYDVIRESKILGVWEDVRKGLDWFIDNNAKAYIALLD